MSEKRPGITRRDFVRGSAYVGLGAALGFGTTIRGDDTVPRTAKAILIRDERAIGENHRPNASVLQKMLDRAVMELLNQKDVARAWKILVKPSDIVGIKTNVWSHLATPRDLESAIRSRVMEAGVSEKGIRIDDRGARTTLGDCTALINVRPLRTHHWSGVGGCIKNYIMFVSRPSDYHDDICADLGAIWNLPIVKGKTRLNILVMLTPLFYGKGAHHFDERYVWDYKGLIVSGDPVAADSIGVSILEAKRQIFFDEEKPLRPMTRHILYADSRHGIGVCDRSRIELVKMGWKKDLLIE